MNDLTSQPMVRVAVIQLGTILFDLEGTVEKVRTKLVEAASGGAQLAVLPEAAIGGYFKGLTFGVTIGSRSDEGREAFRLAYEQAIEVPGPVVDEICETARTHSIAIVIGVVERCGGTLYCTALYINSDGQLLGKHRKVMPTAMERVVWGSGDGSTLGAQQMSVGNVGAVICWENYMPLLRMSMYAQGVELYCALTVDDRDVWQSTMQHIALEGRCFVLSACQYQPTGSAVPKHPTLSDGERPQEIRGGSVIVGPLGQALAGPVYDQETILYADLDRHELARSRLDFDVVGHYSRPDIFHLSVNREERVPVEFRNQGSSSDSE